jgi:hypothetical protein
MPYRDDEHVLRAKQADLERDLASIGDKLRDLDALKKDETRVAGELDDVRERIEARKRRLPTLDNLRVASPCSADWGAMLGDDQSRFCTSCAKNVYNLSAMTRDEAERLIQEKEGDVCVRFHQRKDGTVMTSDCPVGVKKKRVRVAVTAIAVGAGLGAMAAFHHVQRLADHPEGMRMGGIEAFDEQQHIEQVMMGAPLEHEVEDEPEPPPPAPPKPKSPPKKPHAKKPGPTNPSSML